MNIGFVIRDEIAGRSPQASQGHSAWGLLGLSLPVLPRCHPVYVLRSPHHDASSSHNYLQPRQLPWSSKQDFCMLSSGQREQGVSWPPHPFPSLPLWRLVKLQQEGTPHTSESVWAGYNALFVNSQRFCGLFITGVWCRVMLINNAESCLRCLKGPDSSSCSLRHREPSTLAR